MMKKTVLISAPKYYGIDTDIKEAFETHGFRAVLSNYRMNFTLLENVCRKIGIKFPFLKPVLNLVIKFYLTKENNEFINYVINEKPDLLFVIKGDHLFPTTLERLKGMLSCPIAGYAWDDPFYSDENNLQDDFRRSNFKNGIYWYDHIFVFDTYYVEMIREKGAKGVSYLPLATNPKRYREIKISQQDRELFSHDVCFIGVPFPNRVDIFKGLDKYDLGVYGDHWKKYFIKKGQKIPSYYKGKATGEIVNKIYLCSKITLNIHHPHSIEGLNTRTFDIPACGAFEVVDHIKNIERHFELDKEIVTFKDINELKNKIDHYLERSELREAISKNGKQRVLNDHTWENRIAEIINTMEGYNNKNSQDIQSDRAASGLNV